MAKTATKSPPKKRKANPPPGAGGQYERSSSQRKPIRTSLASRALASLIQPEAKSIADMAEQMDTDYQVTLAKTTLFANISAIEVKFEATGEDPRAKLMAEQIGKLWKAHLHEMTAIIADGRVAFEKLWAFNAEANVNYVPKLQPLPFRQTEMRLVKGTGDFDGIDLKYGDDNNQTLTIPPSNAWWLALDATAIQPHGKSRYVGAPHKVWKERQQAIRLRMLFIQRLVLRGGVAHCPDELILEDGQELDAFTEMAKAHSEMQAGGLVVLSNEKDGEGDYKFNITESPTILDPGPLDTHIDGLDQDQLQSFCIPPKVVIEGDAVGSFAMVSQQRLILDAVVEHILNQILGSFQKYVIDKEVEATFGPNSPVKIKASFKSLLDQPSQTIANVVEAILTSSALPKILTSGIIDVKQLLEESRIPLLPGAKEAIDKLLQQALDQAQITQQFQQQQLQQGAPPGQPPLPGEPSEIPPAPTGEAGGEAERESGGNPAGAPADFANPYHSPHDGKFTTANARLDALIARDPRHDLIAHMRHLDHRADTGTLISARDLRKASGLPKDEFDRVALDFARLGRISIHRHDLPMSLSLEQLDELIHDPTAEDYGHSGRTLKGTFYVGAAIPEKLSEFQNTG